MIKSAFRVYVKACLVASVLAAAYLAVSFSVLAISG